FSSTKIFLLAWPKCWPTFIPVRPTCTNADWAARTIWQYAKDNKFTIISKDSDFQERSVLRGYPPKVVWLRAANCTTAQIESLLRTASPLIARFIQQDEESCLVLGPGPMTK